MGISKSLSRLTVKGLVLVVCSISFLIIGCEDDPLLEAPSSAASGGSYGRLSIDATAKTDSSSQQVVIEEKNNPKIF